MGHNGQRTAMVVYSSALVCARTLGAAVLVLASGSAWRAAAQSQDGAFPSELYTIAAVCRENSARIVSMQLSGTMVMTGRRFENQWDPVANETYDSRTHQFSIWKDALHCRFDVTTDRTINEQGEVIYNLPAGEHIASVAKLERDGWEGRVERKRKYGTPQTTQRRIVSPAANYWYQVEGHRVSIGHPNLHRHINNTLEMRLAMNKVFFKAFTMAELIDRWAELCHRGGSDAPRLLEVIPSADGQYRVRVVSATGADSSEIVVDLKRGGNILAYKESGRTTASGQFDYAKAGDAWVLAHAEIAEYGADGVLDAHMLYVVDPASIQVNEPIDPYVFTWEALDVRKGAHVTDIPTGSTYWYDDLPTDLKIAIALAREQEEEAAEAAARARETPAAPAPATAEPRPQPSPTDTEQPSTPTIASTAREAKPSVERMAAEPTDRVETPQTGTSTPLPPESRPTATRPAATRPSARPPLPEAEPAAADDAAAAAAGPTERQTPTHTATVVAVSAGCVAALGIGLWKVTRRGARLPK